MKENQSQNKILVGSLVAIAGEVLFGFSFIFSKQAATANGVFALLSWRFVIAFLGMTVLALLGIINIELKNKPLKTIILISLLQPVLYFIAETFGIVATTASESGSILACIPVMSMLASTVVLRKRPANNQIVGIIITMLGVILCVLAKGSSTSFSLFGYFMLGACIIIYPLYCVFVELAQEYSHIEKTYVMACCGAIAFSAIVIVNGIIDGNVGELLTLPFTDKDFLIAVLYQGIGCSIIAFFCSNYALATIGTNRTASFIGLSTVIGILAGVVILGEEFTRWQIVGTTMVLIGVYVANMVRARK